MENKNENEFQSAFKAGQEASKTFNVNETNYLIAVPVNTEIESLEYHLPRPLLKQGKANFDDVRSFITYANKHKTEHLEIFADVNKNSITAIFDHHSEKETGWSQFRAIYSFPFSKKFQPWFDNDGRFFSQVEFGQFLDETRNDLLARNPDEGIHNPTSSDLVSMVTNLKQIKDVKFESKVNLRNGLSEFVWKESEKQETGVLTIPEVITIGLPIYIKGKSYKIDVRLFYFISGGRLSFKYKLDQIDDIIESAFDDIVKDVESGVEGIHVLLGNF